MKPHKHAELIKAWADGASIEVRYYTTHWLDWRLKNDHIWYETDYVEYRIKPEPKSDIYCQEHFYIDEDGDWMSTNCAPANLKLIFDGETRKLKDAEVLK